MAIQIHYWSPDVERQLAYYVDALSFELVHRQPEDAPADFCILKLQGAQIMIGANPEALISADRADHRLFQEVAPRVGVPGPISVYIGVDDIDAFHGQAVTHGARIVEPIWDAPWGQRQFSVMDPDDNITTFFAA
jgi:catechol 2,3-dioxygenase-like lactoylglutathione lyase family enzyme